MKKHTVLLPFFFLFNSTVNLLMNSLYRFLPPSRGRGHLTPKVEQLTTANTHVCKHSSVMVEVAWVEVLTVLHLGGVHCFPYQFLLFMAMRFSSVLNHVIKIEHNCLGVSNGIFQVMK